MALHSHCGQGEAKAAADLVEALEGEIRHTDFGRWACHEWFENEAVPAFAEGSEQVGEEANELGAYEEFQGQQREAWDEMGPDEGVSA
jgi:hypothetical protein